MTGIFITSTGTNIGKTTLLAHLLRYDQQAKARLTASKPLISGWPKNNKDIQHTDTGILLAAQALPLSQDNIDWLSPWRFMAPLTPSMAAKSEGKSIDCQDILAHSQRSIVDSHRRGKIHLIEGVGGIMVPIWDKWTCLDWLVQLSCHCILVVGSYLGTLSHTLTAVTVLQMKKVPILAIVVSESSNSTVGLMDTCDELAHFLSPIPIYSLPYAADFLSVTALYQGILRLAAITEDNMIDFV